MADARMARPYEHGEQVWTRRAVGGRAVALPADHAGAGDDLRAFTGPYSKAGTWGR
ncbi:MAG: hypothetical protein IPK19_41770 [Chloroflexi bacterium]|nr:hypothetical protein [Chloroflexota bacterium]